MRANSFDQQVKRDAQAISNDYADLVALSIRQSFAASEITISKNGDGIFDTSDVLMFLKGEQTLSLIRSRTKLRFAPQRFPAMA